MKHKGYQKQQQQNCKNYIIILQISKLNIFPSLAGGYGGY